MDYRRDSPAGRQEMTEPLQREEMKKMRRACNDKVRKFESSRDFWKFTAIALFFVTLVCILYLAGCFPDSN
jgi:hypothetical protein